MSFVRAILLSVFLLSCAPAAQPEQDEPLAPDAGGESEVSTKIMGQVVDALGRGVEHTNIVVVNTGDDTVTGQGTSDAYGDFNIEIPGSHPGRFKLTLTHDGFEDGVVEFEVQPDDLQPFVDAMLTGALLVSGRVIGFEGERPIEGASVRFEALYRITTTKTDGDGRFEFRQLIAGPAEVSAEAPGFGKNQVHTQIGESDQPLLIVLKPERILRVSLHDDRGQPVPGAAVELVIDDPPDYRSGTADEDGRLVFDRLPFDTARARLRVTHRDFVATGRYDHLVEFPTVHKEVEHTLQLEPAAVVRGRVLDAALKQPLNGARIDVGPRLSYDAPHTFTNNAGEFSLGSLPPGPTVIHVSVAGHAPYLTEVTTTARETTFVEAMLDSGRTVSGVIRDPAHQPIASALVEARKWRKYETLGMSASSDSQGRFTLYNAPADEFLVDIRAPGHAPLFDQPISAERNDYQFELEVGGEPSPAGPLTLAALKADDPCPPFKLKTLKGREIDNDSVREKVLLLDFWATWCGPCVAELPALKKLYKSFAGNEGFVMIGISGDFDQKSLDKMIADQELKWPQVFGPGSGAEELATACGVQALPCSILIGRNGRVTAVGLTGEALYQQIETLLQPPDK